MAQRIAFSLNSPHPAGNPPAIEMLAEQGRYIPAKRQAFFHNNGGFRTKPAIEQFFSPNSLKKGRTAENTCLLAGLLLQLPVDGR
ncbi:hypothetical protein ABE504_12875 [Paenibacillus oryzisoli]|uniref:hypothetical protein n=1 Tax=Paenibacillus oryzisoli TaxID=1850517 RepID=UPI003D29ED2B